MSNNMCCKYCGINLIWFYGKKQVLGIVVRLGYKQELLRSYLQLWHILCGCCPL